MKKTIIYILGLLIALSSCTKDPLKDITGSTDWQKERNITLLLLDGQIGTAATERNFDEAKIKIFAKLENIADLSSVEIKDIQMSYGATTPNTAGTFLDFSTDTAFITVVSGAGESLDWQVELLPFNSDLEGTWYVNDMMFYCDMFTWEDWGWTETLNLVDFLPEAAPELDNVFIFEIESADENGNPYGTYTHTSGTDGNFGDFTNTTKGWDYNERYRKIPTGEGTWLRDYARSKVVITDQYLVEHELDLEIEESGNIKLKAPLEYLAGEFNWDNTDWDYEKVAHMSNPMWYTLTQERVVQTGNDILSFAIKNQVGETAIDKDNKIVTVTIPNDGTDISAIEITQFSISYAATADKAVGDLLDFSNENTAKINVTAESGDATEWSIKLQIDLDPGDVSIAGTWSVDEMMIYCDMFTWESWGWDKTEGLQNYMSNAASELDNTITFNVDGTNEKGQPYGTFEHNAGDDGAYADFTSTDTSWPETDFNVRYRHVPTANGTWVLDGETLTITIPDAGDYVLTLEVKTENQIAITKEVEYLNDLYDWDVQNYSYEEVAHMSKKMWYTLNK